MIKYVEGNSPTCKTGKSTYVDYLQVLDQYKENAEEPGDEWDWPPEASGEERLHNCTWECVSNKTL